MRLFFYQLSMSEIDFRPILMMSFKQYEIKKMFLPFNLALFHQKNPDHVKNERYDWNGIVVNEYE